MKTIEYRTIDKSAWGRGPWTDEPDKKQWRDEATGLPCLAVRNRGGAWCGYVGVPKSHPWHGKDYSADVVAVDVHGGLTFSDHCATFTREAWERWRAALTARRDEARRYPEGDAARFLREWAAALESYEAWVEHGRSRWICHMPEPGEPDDVWWFGFDCAHYGDVAPAHERLRSFATGDEVYRTLAYVEREVRALARQLAAAAA